jgi:hypothetical protein
MGWAERLLLNQKSRGILDAAQPLFLSDTIIKLAKGHKWPPTARGHFNANFS